MGYKGNATIDFHINRVKDLNTDAYRPITDADDPDREEELELEIEGRSYFQEGRMYGPPENCYPDEGETEILSITWKGKPFPWELTEKETEEAEEMIANAVQEDEGPDPDDYYDSRCDD
jgi:hypothetical protein